jgi:hypothetical protein
LIPAYWALASRYSQEVVGAPQPDIFGGDYENQLHGQWLRFAIDYMHDGERPMALRMVLQATIGLKGGRDHQAAGQSLLDHVRDMPPMPVARIPGLLCPVRFQRRSGLRSRPETHRPPT